MLFKMLYWNLLSAFIWQNPFVCDYDMRFLLAVEFAYTKVLSLEEAKIFPIDRWLVRAEEEKGLARRVRAKLK